MNEYRYIYRPSPQARQQECSSRQLPCRYAYQRYEPRTHLPTYRALHLASFQESDGNEQQQTYKHTRALCNVEDTIRYSNKRSIRLLTITLPAPPAQLKHIKQVIIIIIIRSTIDIDIDLNVRLISSLLPTRRLLIFDLPQQFYLYISLHQTLLD
jgi:hypothetical protein